jgi:hypothetical protein
MVAAQLTVVPRSEYACANMAAIPIVVIPVRVIASIVPLEQHSLAQR